VSIQNKLLGGLALAALALSLMAASASAKVAEFASEKYPAEITSEMPGEQVFTIKAGKIKCKSATFSGKLAAQAGSLVVSPGYGLCTAFGQAAAVNNGGCTYKLIAGLMAEPNEAMGLMTIGCPAGAALTFTVVALGCKVEIPPAEEIGFVDYLNSKAVLNVSFNIQFDYVLNNKCGVPEGKYEDGIYTGKVTLKGNAGPIGVL
jgi:hypothetical protein